MAYDFSRFSEAAISIFQIANVSAQLRQAPTIGTDDLVYAIVMERRSAAATAILEILDQPGQARGNGYKKIERLLHPTASGSSSPSSSAARSRMEPQNVLELDSFARLAIDKAIDLADQLGLKKVGADQFLLGILMDSGNRGTQLLKNAGVDPTHISRVLRNLNSKTGGGAASARTTGSSRPATRSTELDKYTTDLTQLALDGKLEPLHGRAAEMGRIIDILGQMHKNNPIILGEPGVGKTAVMKGLAQLIIDGKVPTMLRDCRMLLLDVGSLVAGTTLRGQFEERVKTLLDEVHRAGNIVLAIDEIHTVVGSGAAEGSADLSNMLKSALQDGLRLIGTTTLSEFRRIDKDQALSRRFQPVKLDEPDLDGTIKIMKALKPRYEAHHGITIPDAVIELAATLSARYITNRNQPDKTIDVIDEAGSHLRQTASDDKAVLTLSEQDVAAVVSRQCDMPVTKLTQSEREKLLGLEAILHESVIGQEQAIRAVSAAMRRSGVKLNPSNKPIASFIFSGPTGVGKTELAKTLAQVMFGSEKNMVRLDMSEYMERHTVSRLVGSPPGYVGHEEGGQLTNAVRNRPYTVVLFDEIEKAHPDVFNVLLQVLDDARLTDSQGRTVDFKNTVVIMTTNVGSQAIQGKNKGIGFEFGTTDAKAEVESMYETIKAKVLESLKQYFRPEFLNRISETIVFRPLLKEEVYKIIDILLLRTEKVLADQGITIKLNKPARDVLIEKGYSATFGARALQRAITDLLEDPLATLLLEQEPPKGSVIEVDGVKGELVLSSVSQAKDSSQPGSQPGS